MSEDESRATPEPDAARPVVAPAASSSGDEPPMKSVSPAEGEPRRGLFRRGPKPHRTAPWWELPALIVLAILIAILVKTFVVQPFYIPSESMEKTLHGCTGCSGDRILVNKPVYDIRDPHPGDIVVFDAPKNWNETGEAPPAPPTNPVAKLVRGFGQLVGFVPPDDLVLVKRVIAVGGQTVMGVSTNAGRTAKVMVSDHGTKGPWHTLKESYVDLDFPDSSANFGPVTVPQGRLWVMGDHRNRSADSRYHCGTNASDSQNLRHCHAMSSTVPIDDVIGKAIVIAWPPSRWRTLGTPSTFSSAAASGVLPLGVVLPVFLLRRRRRGR